MMWYWNGGWSWFGWLGMTLTMLIFWGLVIWGIFTLVRYFDGPRSGAVSARGQETSPEAILAARFARGEIGEDEFTRKRDVVRAGTQFGGGGQ